ncbi:hypothetical protein SASC598O02_001140, partial [Snodgrassella alvi SCGC AB-598-O02]
MLLPECRKALHLWHRKANQYQQLEV